MVTFPSQIQGLVSLVAQMVKNLPVIQETLISSLGWEDPLDKGMATHSRTLAWRTPWVEESGGLQSMESLRVGHTWVTNTHFFTLYFQRKMTPSSREARRLRASFLLRNASAQPLLGASYAVPPSGSNGQVEEGELHLQPSKGCRTLQWQSQQRTKTAQNGMSELHGQRAKGESGVRATSTPSARRDIPEGPVFEQEPSGISSNHWKEG